MAANTSAGVRTFSHKPGMKKGKHHPAEVGGGPSTVEKLGGSYPPTAKAPRGSASYPSGVVRGSGTEPRSKKNAPKTLQKTVGSAHKAPRKDHKPVGVQVGDGSGLKAPHRVK